MVFSSMLFLWLFLPCALVGSRIAPKKLVNLFLLACSLFFYAWGEPIYILLMLVSVLSNWILGLTMEATSHKKLILVIDIMFNLALLAYFKYANLLVETFNQFAGQKWIEEPNIPLPIGISFFVCVVKD